ncbi:MAG: minor capsid protein, partial [Ruminococcus sp.]|nr:minor capsid protein [Ruminococcus sp.]
MDNYTLAAFDTARTIQRSYNTLETYIKTEIAKILRNVGDEGTLAYEYRMKRLNALLINTEQKFKELYGINLGDTTAFLKSIIPEAYYHTIFDIAQGVGVQPAFTSINTRLINKIINENWSGKNYSKRLWANTDKLAEELREVLTEAAVTGESIYKTSKKVAEKFDTASYNAERLIRTETTYATNQAEQLAYDELDIDEYEFVATLDTRTSAICQKLDGKIFKTKDAQAGKNLPAMHPNCRSTTIPHFKEGNPTMRTARDKDGKRIMVPASMKYDEWYKKYIEPTKKAAPSKVPKATPAEIQVSKAEKPENAYTAEKINKKSIEKAEKSGIIESRKIVSRNLPNGLRTAPSHILTDDEILNLKKDIEAIGADVKVFKFNTGMRTGYDDILDEIRVKGDILPDLNSKHPRDKMSARA